VAQKRIVQVDFNARDTDGHVLALEKDARGLKIRTTVLLRDAEGNEAQAEVAEAGDRLIRLRVDWDSWIPAPEAFVAGSTAPMTLVSLMETHGATSQSAVEDLLEALTGKLRSSAGASVAPPISLDRRRG
jgi:hypothetical protein